MQSLLCRWTRLNFPWILLCPDRISRRLVDFWANKYVIDVTREVFHAATPLLLSGLLLAALHLSLVLVPVSEGSHSAASRTPTSSKKLTASKMPTTSKRSPRILSSSTNQGRAVQRRILNLLFRVLLLLILLGILSLEIILLNELGPRHTLELTSPLFWSTPPGGNPVAVCSL